MGVLMVVKASRPGRDAGKGVCWDTRDAHDNQGGNRDDNSKRHDQFLPQTAGLDLIPNATPLITLASAGTPSLDIDQRIVQRARRPILRSEFRIGQ
jgi:hypothetical protein